MLETTWANSQWTSVIRAVVLIQRTTKAYILIRFTVARRCHLETQICVDFHSHSMLFFFPIAVKNWFKNHVLGGKLELNPVLLTLGLFVFIFINDARFWRGKKQYLQNIIESGDSMLNRLVQKETVVYAEVRGPSSHFWMAIFILRPHAMDTERESGRRGFWGFFSWGH